MHTTHETIVPNETPCDNILYRPLRSFTLLFSTKGALKYTGDRNAETFGSIVARCWAHSSSLFERKHKINVSIVLMVFLQICHWQRGSGQVKVLYATGLLFAYYLGNYMGKYRTMNVFLAADNSLQWQQSSFRIVPLFFLLVKPQECNFLWSNAKLPDCHQLVKWIVNGKNVLTLSCRKNWCNQYLPHQFEKRKLQNKYKFSRNSRHYQQHENSLQIANKGKLFTPDAPLDAIKIYYIPFFSFINRKWIELSDRVRLSFKMNINGVSSNRSSKWVSRTTTYTRSSAIIHTRHGGSKRFLMLRCQFKKI